MDSKAWWPPASVPPKGAPNIVLIMTDDVGFGAPSTFGGFIPTPALDRLAKMGLRYTFFHSTSLYSPTRASLITGRNHHSVHTGVVMEIATVLSLNPTCAPTSRLNIAELDKWKRKDRKACHRHG